jgi:PAS domain S-box-containing protein
VLWLRGRDKRLHLRRPVEVLARLIAATPRNLAYSILVGLGLVGVATGLSAALQALLKIQGPYIFYFVAVPLASVLGGYSAGFTVLAVAALIGWQASAHTPYDPEQRAVLFTLFVISGALDTLIAASVRDAVLLAQEREARARRLVEANIIGNVVWTRGGRITEANDAFLALVGYDREDLLSGGLSWTDMTPPEWRDADRRATDQIRAGGFAHPFEKEFIRKDGRRVPVLLGPAAFSDTAEEGVAFILDLSEQKESERRLKLMVDELNHRVRNTLATVMAITGRSLRTATSLDGFRQAFQGRLAALSKTHDLLNQTFWTGVRLRDLVENNLAPYADRERIVVSGEDIDLGPVAAVTLGLALDELARNAARFGALSTPSGQVRISWRPGAPGRLRLDWEELGGPQVAPPSRRGFGSELIGKVLAGELNGEVRLEFPPQGVRCTMDMALERVSAH